jgi:hypothetical protein
MDPEFLLTVQYVGAALALFGSVAFLVLLMRWAGRRRNQPVSVVYASLFLIGLLMLTCPLLDTPNLLFDIPTPFGRLPSEWAGATLIVISLALRISARKRKLGLARRGG